MTWPNGQISVYVALELGPSDTPTEPDWTDLTERVKEYRDERGRRDVLQAFQPGTAEVVLDNGDRALDPSNHDGLLFNGSDEPIGLPLCPVKITQWWDGVEYPKFTGYLGPEAWPGDAAPYGPSGTTTMYVVDALGWSPGLPGDVWGILTKSLRPDWWLRMDVSFVLDVSSPVYDAVTTGWAEIQGSTGISRPFWSQTYGDLGTFAPGLLVSGDHELVSYATDIMPNGDESELTMWMWWSARTQMTTGQSAVVARMYAPGGGDYRWDIVVDGDDGLAYVTTYDAGGTPIDSATISPIYSSRWDESALKHHVIARYIGGELTVWFGGVSATLDGTTDLYESDLSCGPASVDVMIDEVTVWRRALSVEGEIEPTIAAGGYLVLWAGDTVPYRLGRWIEATGRDVAPEDTAEWHVTDLETEALWGLLRPRAPTTDRPVGTVTADLPDTIADAYQMTVSDIGGVRWATRGGRLRVRDRGATTDSYYAAHYATPVEFTDVDDTLTTDQYRHAGVRVTGKRIDRVINVATIEFYPSGPPPTFLAAEAMKITERDHASVARYGERIWTLESSWSEWSLLGSIISDVIDRFAQPQQEIENIHLDPTGTGADELALAEWLVTTCELELACTVSYASDNIDPEGDPIGVTIEGLNIQHISTDWTPERWSVDIVAAAS